MLFGQNFENMGGTVSGPTSNNTGVRLFWEILFDNMGRFFATSALSTIALLPAVVGIVYALSQNGALLLLLAGVLGGMIAGAAYGAMMDGVMRAIRGEMGRWWDHYREAWKRDWKANLLPGGVLGCLVAMVVDVLVVLQYGEDGVPTSILVCTIISVVLTLAVFTYLWPQRVLLDLPLRYIFRNSLLMILAHPLVTLLSVVVQLCYWVLLALLIPYSLIVYVLLGLWFPAVVGTMIVYKKLDADFKIEERLNAALRTPREEDEEEATENQRQEW
ncbi:MAG: hypothetical protein LUF86_03110 [Clostridiales bacterium]|nr:hypothetical protein [Clostridiales bacterium]